MAETPWLDGLAVPGFCASPNRTGGKSRNSQSSQSRSLRKGKARTGKGMEGKGIVSQGKGRELAAETPCLIGLAVPGFFPSPNRNGAQSRNSQSSQSRKERKGNERGWKGIVSQGKGMGGKARQKLLD